jgi:SSS family solute:Na+ symporter
VPRLGGVFRYFQTGVTYLATPFISVMLLGILWKRANYAGALFGIIGGLCIQMGLAVALPYMWPGFNYLYIAAIAEALIFLGIVIVSLMTPAPTPDRWGPFLWTPGVLKQLAIEEPRPWYQNVWLWFGIFAAIWIAIYVRYW